MTILAANVAVANVGGMADTELVEALLVLRRDAVNLEAACGRELELVSAGDRPSARNLLHYVALRQHDVREVPGSAVGGRTLRLFWGCELV